MARMMGRRPSARVARKLQPVLLRGLWGKKGEEIKVHM